MRAHEAGALHGDLGHPGPGLAAYPGGRQRPGAAALAAHRARAAPTARSPSAGVDVRELAAEFGTPAYVLDEDDLRSRCRDFRAAFAGDGRLLRRQGVPAAGRWSGSIAEEGLNLDVCTGGELAVALAAGMPPERIGFHGNNKSRRRADAGRSTPGVGRIVVDSFDEIDRLTALARERGVRPRVHGPGHRRRRGAHPRVHRHRARGPEVRLLAGRRRGVRGGRRGSSTRTCWSCAACTRTSARRSSTPPASRSPPAGCSALQAQIRDARGVELPELDLGGGFGIAYTTQDDPATPQRPGQAAAQDRRRRSAPRWRWPCRTCRSSRAGRIVGPAVFTLYEVGTVKDVDGIRTYVSVDGGMSDNIRTALYDASYSATLAVAGVSAPTPMLARVVGKHCEAGDIVVKDEFLPADVQPGDLLAVPGTGAYCRSMASNYNHVPRPPVVAVARRRRPG